MDHDSSKRSTRSNLAELTHATGGRHHRRDGAEGDDDRPRRGEHRLHPRFAAVAAEPAPRYQAVDAAIGELLNGCRHEHTTFIIVAAHGMGRNASQEHFTRRSWIASTGASPDRRERIAGHANAA